MAGSPMRLSRSSNFPPVMRTRPSSPGVILPPPLEPQDPPSLRATSMLRTSIGAGGGAARAGEAHARKSPPRRPLDCEPARHCCYSCRVSLLICYSYERGLCALYFPCLLLFVWDGTSFC
uniref:Uncharacterized protein n=1 Tax=Arundo donax TaxID=35708 RepID=A0A0A9RIB1_ARUDO